MSAGTNREDRCPSSAGSARFRRTLVYICVYVQTKQRTYHVRIRPGSGVRRSLPLRLISDKTVSIYRSSSLACACLRGPSASPLPPLITFVVTLRNFSYCLSSSPSYCFSFSRGLVSQQLMNNRAPRAPLRPRSVVSHFLTKWKPEKERQGDRMYHTHTQALPSQSRRSLPAAGGLLSVSRVADTCFGATRRHLSLLLAVSPRTHK